MENTGYLIMNSSKKLTYELNTTLRSGDLTAPQWAVIQQIHRFEEKVTPITAKQLTKLLEMDKPTVSAIIKRLEAMTEATDNEIQVRRFEKEGVEKCLVTYDKATETFELTESDSQQSYQFDNIDIVAMEIYDLIQ